PKQKALCSRDRAFAFEAPNGRHQITSFLLELVLAQWLLAQRQELLARLQELLAQQQVLQELAQLLQELLAQQELLLLFCHKRPRQLRTGMRSK
ncbi:MAG TPA: hypothetical protein VFV39_11845, partial [Limnobacter sp.]|nr:hypothetical protein [Limnobacter sp.]